MGLASLLLVLQLAIPDVASDRCLMKAFGQLLERGEGIVGRLEAAAFLIREADGSWTMVLWPSRKFARRETFTGVIPSGTVAIVHTHPPQMERPSRGDLAEAKRLKMPIYVVSFWQIWVADPLSGAVQIVARSHWSRNTSGGDCRPAFTRADLQRH